jgi:hypothetical protein
MRGPGTREWQDACHPTWEVASVADEGVERPGQDRPPGWYPAGATPNEQVHWDGQQWTARRRWVHSAWVDVPMDAGESPGRMQPTSSTRGHRWSTTTVALLVIALLGLGSVIFAVVSGVNSAPTPKSTSATTVATSKPAPTSTPTSVTIQQASQAEVAACESDAKVVQVALAAYQAQQGHYPSPAPWSAAAYAGNYLPLTSAGAGGGPYLHNPPATTHYIVEFDSSGHVWIAPPGAYDAYNQGQDFDANPEVCLAAIG